MFRKLLFAAVTGLGLLAVAPAAKADVLVTCGPHYHVGHRHDYHVGHHYYGPQVYRPFPVVRYRPYNVYYRTCPTAPWAVYQAYPVYHDACNATFGLRARGFEVYVR